VGIHVLAWEPLRCSRASNGIRLLTERAYDADDPIQARANLARLRSLVHQCPEQIDLPMLAAANYRILGRTDDAMRMYELALEYDRRPEILANLAELQFGAGQTETAIRNLVSAATFAPRSLDMITPGPLRQAAFARLSSANDDVVRLTNGDFSVPSRAGALTYRGAGMLGPSAAASWDVYANAQDSVHTELIPSTRRRGRTMLHVSTRAIGSGISQIWAPAGSGPTGVSTDMWVFVRKGAVLVGSGNMANVVPDAYAKPTGKWQRVTGLNTTCPVSQTLITAGAPNTDFYIDSISVTPVEGRDCTR
jgi:hypothetical protein